MNIAGKRKLFICDTFAFLDYKEVFETFIQGQIDKNLSNISSDLILQEFDDEKLKYVKEKSLELKSQISFRTTNFPKLLRNETTNEFQDTTKDLYGFICENLQRLNNVFVPDGELEIFQPLLAPYKDLTSYFLKDQTLIDDNDLVTSLDDFTLIEFDRTVFPEEKNVAEQSQCDYIAERFYEDIHIYNELASYYTYKELVTTYNNMLSYEDIQEIKDSGIHIKDTRKIIILNELGVLDKIKEDQNYQEWSNVGYEVAKLLGMNRDHAATIVRSIKHATQNTKNNPYSAKGNKDFISHFKKLIS